MTFNRWRRYPIRKPKESGWYLCTTRFQFPSELTEEKCFVHQLFYDSHSDKWIDISRQSVFEGYVVYKSCRAPIQENHVHFDSLCERDDVLAWRKIPKPCRVSREKHELL